MNHVVLFGDSVFDNRAYTGREPDVSSHLRSVLGDWSVTLCAVDGSTTQDVGRQFDRMPRSATHAVMSVGGNDALQNADLLDMPVRSTGAALDLFLERIEEFEVSFGYALDGLLDLGLPTVVCTVYNGNLAEPQARRSRVALMMFNDVILRAALKRSVDVIDTRLVCNQPEDFANPIEPSGSGGRKLANAVAVALSALGESGRSCRMSAG